MTPACAIYSHKLGCYFFAIKIKISSYMIALQTGFGYNTDCKSVLAYTANHPNCKSGLAGFFSW
jgi:hypothetical protein